MSQAREIRKEIPGKKRQERKGPRGSRGAERPPTAPTIKQGVKFKELMAEECQKEALAAHAH